MNRILVCSDGRSFASVDAAAATGLLPQAISIAAVYTRDGIHSEYDGCQWAFKDTLPLVWPQPDPRQAVDKDKDNQSVISSDGRNYSSFKTAAKSTGLLYDGILFAVRCTSNNTYYKYGGCQWAFANQKFRVWPRVKKNDETAYKAPEPLNLDPTSTSLKRFKVRVFQDHVASPTDYAVWASTQIDARIIAFVLDGGFPSDMFGVDLDHVELVREHTEVLTTPELNVPTLTPEQAVEMGRRAWIDAKIDEMIACWGCPTSKQPKQPTQPTQPKGETMFKLARLLAHNNLSLETEYSDINGDIVLVLRKTDAENLCCSFDITKNDGTFEEIKKQFFDPAIAYFQQIQRMNVDATE